VRSSASCGSDLPGPGRGESDEPALEVGNAVFGGAFTSRLNLKLREEKGFTYGVRSRFAMRRRGGSFAVGTSVQREVTAQALADAMIEFERFVEAGPSEEEVVRARDYLAGIFPLRMESAAQLAARLAEVHIFGLADDYHHHYRDRIRAVSTEAVATAVSRGASIPREPGSSSWATRQRSVKSWRRSGWVRSRWRSP
jgi:zinc protease